jgi:hypothetical protein
VDFKSLLGAADEAIKGLPWWGIDYCFNADVEKDAGEAAAFVRSVTKEALG